MKIDDQTMTFSLPDNLEGNYSRPSLFGNVDLCYVPVLYTRAGRFLLFFQYFRWLSIKSGTWVRKYLVKILSEFGGAFLSPPGG